ncbi:hypothetical protein Kpol_1050p65 [Vanderwaltozyma polyspora DSM 70294]|uniref:MICOS complex subunit n=1 Tax=Vanderwaltozyma polyspora (strain ATCC 22028 / DSM 70294 / BCRC 21397 / CBS 2163 / NBRC 10782 / NRRL Y-8283 / UCD 57-17) TaxID=436907 RepID=A7TEW1_VANPO|nr:uncharacterized protein Kpol_1050p65 [Vanderwaltozyma polyspora DSM 70294]EDO19207.1 hypothetical protein Kpol_1050p65 [Vanderwaltozyma polyspora DSM 70294]
MGVDYYRQVDLINELVVTKGESIITPRNIAQEEYDLDSPSKGRSKVVKLIGSNRIIDGVSVRCPPYLLNFFNLTGYRLNNRYNNVYNKVEDVSSRYYRMEKKVTSRIAGLHSDRDEQLLKGFAFTLVSGMTGSILFRRRNILARFTMPIVFALACFSYALPTTYDNTMDLIHDVEESLFPNFVAKQDVIVAKGRIGIDHTIMTYEIIKDKLSSVNNFIKGHINFN